MTTLHSGGKTVLLHGLALILAGLLFGFLPPATPFPRLAVGAHIQFVTNGMLFVVLAVIVLAVPHSAGPKSMRVLVVSAWLTWLMALSEAANAWWGANQMLPIAAQQAGATGAADWQELGCIDAGSQRPRRVNVGKRSYSSLRSTITACSP